MNIEEATMKALTGKLHESKSQEVLEIINNYKTIYDKIEEAYDILENTEDDAIIENSTELKDKLTLVADSLDNLERVLPEIINFLENTKLPDLDESKEAKEEFLDPNITIAPSVDLGDGAGLGMLAGML